MPDSIHDYVESAKKEQRESMTLFYHLQSAYPLLSSLCGKISLSAMACTHKVTSSRSLFEFLANSADYYHNKSPENTGVLRH